MKRISSVRDALTAFRAALITPTPLTAFRAALIAERQALIKQELALDEIV